MQDASAARPERGSTTKNTRMYFCADLIEADVQEVEMRFIEAFTDGPPTPIGDVGTLRERRQPSLFQHLLKLATTAELVTKIITGGSRVTAALLPVKDVAVGLLSRLSRLGIVTMVVTGLAVRVTTIGIGSAGVCPRRRDKQAARQQTHQR